MFYLFILPVNCFWCIPVSVCTLNLTIKVFPMLKTSVETFQLDVQMVAVLSGTLKQGDLQENFVIRIVLHL